MVLTFSWGWQSAFGFFRTKISGTALLKISEKEKKRNMSIHSRKLFLVNSRLQHATNTLFSCLFEKKHKEKNWQTQFQSHDPVKFFTYFPPCLLQFFFHHRKKKSFERSFILLSLWHTSGNEKYQAFSHCNSEAVNFQYWKSRQILRLSHVTFFFLKKKKKCLQLFERVLQNETCPTYEKNACGGPCCKLCTRDSIILACKILYWPRSISRSTNNKST